MGRRLRTQVDLDGGLFGGPVKVSVSAPERVEPGPGSPAQQSPTPEPRPVDLSGMQHLTARRGEVVNPPRDLKLIFPRVLPLVSDQFRPLVPPGDDGGDPVAQSRR